MVITFIKSWIIELGLLKLRDNLLLEIERVFLSKLFDKNMMKYTPVIIYQMGKVASASIYHSIRQYYPGIVLHTHTFSSTDRNWKIRRLYEHTIIFRNPLKIITLTREPIGRNISAFFQNFKRDTGVSYLRANFSMAELKELFLNNFPHDEPLQWFDQHILKNFGIDVYAERFPEDGVAQYKNNTFELLILRSEIDDERKKIAIKSFLELPTFELRHKNDGATKGYANTYQKFKNTIALPPEYISKMCTSAYFNQFYSPEFVEETRKKWIR